MAEPQMEAEPAEAAPPEEAKAVPKFPKAVFFVLGSELCERFSYYGIRAVLILYLTRQLKIEHDTTKKIYHFFSMLNYFIPLYGGLLADIYLGKFKTVLYVSIIYACGNIFLSLVSIPQLHLTPKLPLVIVALLLIAIGAGGIKPCVSSFGGDQFVKGQEYMRDKFFSIFYFCINLGAAMSMILSPIFRADVSCLGEMECYPLAFGFPAILMLCATITFVIGRPLYIIYAPHGTAVVDIVRCIWHAIKMRRKSADKKDNWLDYADDKYDPAYIDDVRTVLAIMFLFIPLPMFWALFDQQGSTWTLQSSKLDGRVSEKVEIHPDQMDSMNAILVIVFIPVFTFLLYPLLAKCRLLKTPLQKMTTGGFLASLAFLLGGFIQLAIEARLPTPPPPGTSDIMMINTMNCPIDLKLSGSSIRLKNYDFHMFKEFKNANVKGTIWLSPTCRKQAPNETLAASEDFKFTVRHEKAYSIAIYMTEDGVQVGKPEEQLRKRDMSKASPFVRFIYIGEKPFPNATMLLTQKDLPEESKNLYQQITFEGDSVISDYSALYSRIKAELCWADENRTNCSRKVRFTKKFSVYKGGISDFLVISKQNNTRFDLIEMVSSTADSIHILIQSPMYVLITAGEVMLSISGLTFAYSEAPTGMKAVLQAAWLMTIAFGNVIVLIVIEIKELVAANTLESTYFFVFAALMAVDMVVFAILAIRYKYKEKR